MSKHLKALVTICLKKKGNDMGKEPEIQFLGAAETVTGSKYLVTFEQKKILVDCGLFQGLKNLRLKNWDRLPVDPHDIDALILTHAHLDHSGYIPKLIREGFRGKIYATAATKSLCEILLSDSGFLMEEEARFQNKRKISKHSPALPLYTMNEAQKAMEYFVPSAFHKSIPLFENISFEFRYAGHILGAASVSLTMGSTKIFFSGDVGRQNDPLFYPPENVPPADYLILESTYGNRLHPKTDAMADLAKHINRACQRGGVILVPSFAVGRTQLLIYYIADLKKKKIIPDIPVYLNSPMAKSATEIFLAHNELHKLSQESCREIFDPVHYIQSMEDSIALNLKTGPMIIISASGMLAGGRILHHMESFASDPKNMVLLTGFQAAGTRGKALRDGAKEIKIHGHYIPVHAEIIDLEYLSAHADYGEMIAWLKRSPDLHPKKVFVTHGEPEAADDFRRRLTESFGWNCVVPSSGFIS